MNNWCLQCGKDNRPTPATGIDSDGEPACDGHRVRVPALVEHLIEGSEEAMADRKCKGYEKDCDEVISERNQTGLCTRCYARKNYAEHHPKARSNGHKLNGNGHYEPSLKEMLAYLAGKKAELQKELDAIIIVEGILQA